MSSSEGAKTSDVSVGIVVYNTSPEVLERTLKTISASDEPVQILLLCNSPDAAYNEYLGKLSSRFPKIAGTYLHTPNEGFGAGHNRLIKAAKTRWYICCNPDVAMESSTMGTLKSFAEEHPEGVLFAPRFLSEDGMIQKLNRPHLSLTTWIARQVNRLSGNRKKTFEESFNYEESGPAQFVSGAFFLASREKLLELGGFDESFFLYCEDADLSLRASRLGPNYYVARAAVTHQWQKGWSRSFRLLLLHVKSLIKYFAKHRIVSAS